MKYLLLSNVILCLVIGVACVEASAQNPDSHEVIKLWPKGARDGQSDTKPEAMRIAPGGDHVITHVAEPSITNYLPLRRRRQERL